jgi:hypothetical protein
MKRSLLIFLMLFLSLQSILSAKIITKDNAIRAAEQIIDIENRDVFLRNNRSFLQLASISELRYLDEIVGYVCNLSPKGFLIVPSFSELPPVFLIMFSCNYNEIIDSPFKDTFGFQLYKAYDVLGYAKQNIYFDPTFVLSENDRETIRKSEKLWNNILDPQYAGITYERLGSYKTPLLSSTWAQGHPYNFYTPVDQGGKSMAGCGPIAVSQIMNYWKYPIIGRGSNSYSWKGNLLSADFNHEYYWNLMLPSYSGNENYPNIDAVARLISDVGISVNANYGRYSTGIGLFEEGLIKHFKYSSHITELQSNRGIQLLLDMTKSELDYDRPSYTIIYSSLGIHSIVIDGYKEVSGQFLVHVNMGWGGFSDGYYAPIQISEIWSLHTIYIRIYPHFAPTLSVRAERRTEKSFSARKDFGIVQFIIENPDQYNFPKYIIYRKNESGDATIFKEIEFPDFDWRELPGWSGGDVANIPNKTYAYQDRYLDKNAKYTYYAVMYDRNGNIVGISNEVEI